MTASLTFLRFPACVLAILWSAGISSLHAQQRDAEAARLRESLRNTALQLRSAQTDLANARSSQAAAEQRSQQLEKQLAEANETLAAQIKRGSEDKTASEQTIATLSNRVAERDKRLAEYVAALEKWKAAYEKAAHAARAQEAERAKLATEAAVLKRTVADREAKNISLFQTATEILDRYENYALGKALTAKEPFIGTARVKIENQVQGYKDRILDQRLSAPTNP